MAFALGVAPQVIAVIATYDAGIAMLALNADPGIAIVTEFAIATLGVSTIAARREIR